MLIVINFDARKNCLFHIVAEIKSQKLTSPFAVDPFGLGNCWPLITFKVKESEKIKQQRVWFDIVLQTQIVSVPWFAVFVVRLREWRPLYWD